MKPEVLLSDEFQQFSLQITEFHKKRKDAEAEFKIIYANHKANLKAIDEEVTKLQQDFEVWATNHTKKDEPKK